MVEIPPPSIEIFDKVEYHEIEATEQDCAPEQGEVPMLIFLNWLLGHKGLMSGRMKNQPPVARYWRGDDALIDVLNWNDGVFYDGMFSAMAKHSCASTT